MSSLRPDARGIAPPHTQPDWKVMRGRTQPAGRTSNPGQRADEDQGREQGAFQHIAPSVGGVPFAVSLARYGGRIALIHVDGELSYAELAERVELRRSQLGDEPALLLMTGGNDVESIITYLAALAGGHAAIVVPACDEVIFEQLAARYMPHTTAKDGVVQRHLSASPDSSPRLHPDLALLLSTSGSTGSPKLVRLSSDNVQSNAESIAQYLEITADDRAITTLPMSYCYGLSVINSHLLGGGAVSLTDESVIS